MIKKYYPPEFNSKSFNCPNCQVFSKQEWFYLRPFKGAINKDFMENLEVSLCSHCDKYSIWFRGRLIVPNESQAPYPHKDLPEKIREDYREARLIVNESPRGAAALLRLCLQKLMKELGESGENINNDIKELVEKGLPIRIQQALDILRVIGNESVHPGEIDIRDDKETAIRLFELINYIVEDRISRPKQIEELYKKLPDSKKEGIKNRDK
jgi:hypothetical protein